MVEFNHDNWIVSFEGFLSTLQYFEIKTVNINFQTVDPRRILFGDKVVKLIKLIILNVAFSAPKTKNTVILNAGNCAECDLVNFDIGDTIMG